MNGRLIAQKNLHVCILTPRILQKLVNNAVLHTMLIFPMLFVHLYFMGMQAKVYSNLFSILSFDHSVFLLTNRNEWFSYGVYCLLYSNI